MRNRNIFLFYLARLFYFPVFWLAVLFIYLTEYRGLSEATALLLVGLQEFLLIFLEIPTGAIADKVSRKFSCALGNLLVYLPLAFLPMVNNLAGFVLIFVFKAIGRALTSGSDKSLLYDTLVDLGRQKDYRQIISRSFALAFGFASLSIFLGGLFVKYGHIEWTLLAPIPFAAITTLAFLFMDEPETTKKAKLIQQSNYFHHIWEAIRFTFATKRILPLVFLLAVADGIAVQLKWFYTPVFNSIGLDIALIGGVTSVLYIAKSFASGMVDRLSARFEPIRMVRYSSLTLTLAFAGMALLLNFPFVTFFFLLIQLGNAAMIVSADELVHEQVSSHHRATVMSTINLSSSVIATGSLAAFGLLHTSFNITWALLSISVLFAAAWLVSQSFAIKR